MEVPDEDAESAGPPGLPVLLPTTPPAPPAPKTAPVTSIDKLYAVALNVAAKEPVEFDPQVP
jgi:hypothetical protein